MTINSLKKLLLALVVALGLVVGFTALGDSVVLANPAQLYESYTTGGYASYYFCGTQWIAQTFTPQTSHKITSVKLEFDRYPAAIGTITASIRATDAGGHPTGGDLCSGTMDGNLLTGSPAWYTITLGSGYNLSAGTKYAIVVRISSDCSTSFANWYFNSSGTYPYGWGELSGNSGSSWASSTGYDFMFEEWGDPVGASQTATFSLSPTNGSTISGTFAVTLNLTDLGGKRVSGVDVYLNYERSKLEAQNINVSGGIFADYPLQTIDSASGKIAIGAIATPGSPVTSPGKIATVTFKALASSGSTTLNFDYTAGSTTDSNITEAGTATDILTQPPTVTYNFGGATTPPPATPPPTTPPPPAASAGGTPKGGIFEPTILISFLSFLLLGLGFFVRIL